MTSKIIYSVASNQLESYATALRRDANESLDALVILGKIVAYDALIEQALVLEYAAGININFRSKYLRSRGYIIKRLK